MIGKWIIQTIGNTKTNIFGNLFLKLIFWNSAHIKDLTYTQINKMFVFSISFYYKNFINMYFVDSKINHEILLQRNTKLVSIVSPYLYAFVICDELFFGHGLCNIILYYYISVQNGEKKKMKTKTNCIWMNQMKRERNKCFHVDICMDG